MLQATRTPINASSSISFCAARESVSPASSHLFSDFSGFDNEEVVVPPTYSLIRLRTTTTETGPLTPPPERHTDRTKRSFDSLQEAFSYLQAWAKDHKYTLRQNRPKKRGKHRTVIYKVYYECDRHGTPRQSKTPMEFRIRLNTSQKGQQYKFGGSIVEEDSL
jgi:hypothetical protein